MDPFELTTDLDEFPISACLIVGGGEIDHTWARDFLAEHADAMTIACDSGIKLFYENGLNPDVFVGDYDSADPEMVAYYEEKEQTLMHSLPVHKDVTDSEDALHVAFEAECNPIYLLGMTGGRIDHELANVQMLRQATAAGVTAYLVDPRCRAHIAAAKEPEKEYSIPDKNCVVRLERAHAYGPYLSLIPIGGPVEGLSIEGAEYPLYEDTLTGDNSLGISNQFAQDVITISFDRGELLIIEARD